MLEQESHFFAYMYRLRFIKRWSLMRNVVEENVAEHSYHVALLTHMLCSIANEIYGRHLNAERAVTLALFHDVTEVFTGDIPTPVKHRNPAIRDSFREIEGHAAERLVEMVPESLRAIYKPLVLHKTPKAEGELKTAGVPEAEDISKAESEDLAAGERKAERELKAIVKAADLLDAYLKCVSELSAGNREFVVAKRQIEQSLTDLQLPEVEYFLVHFAPSLEKTLDEITLD